MINGHSLNGSSRTMLAALKAAIRNGVLVMQAMDDPDYKYRRPLTSTWRISAPDDPNTAYAYTELKLRFVPSPRDITRAEIVDSWLVWLRATEGKSGAHRVWHWARGVPQWLQAQREHFPVASARSSIASIARWRRSWPSSCARKSSSSTSRSRPTSRCVHFMASTPATSPARSAGMPWCSLTGWDL